MISLTQTAYVTNYNDATANAVPSFMAFLLGWMNILGAGISWLANPLLFLSWIMLFFAPKKSLICSALSVLLCLSFLRFNDIIVNEGGGHSDITGYGTGYWLWLVSCCVNCAGTFLVYQNSVKKAA